MAIPKVAEETLEPPFCAVTVIAQWRIYAMGYDAVEHIFLVQIWTMMFGDTIDQHVDKYFEAGNVTGALGKRLLC